MPKKTINIVPTKKELNKLKVDGVTQTKVAEYYGYLPNNFSSNSLSFKLPFFVDYIAQRNGIGSFTELVDVIVGHKKLVEENKVLVKKLENIADEAKVETQLFY